MEYQILVNVGNLNVHACSISFPIPFFSCYTIFATYLYFRLTYFHYFCHLMTLFSSSIIILCLSPLSFPPIEFAQTHPWFLIPSLPARQK